MNIFIYFFSICYLLIACSSNNFKTSNRINGRARCTKSHKQRKITKQHRQLYGVSLSSITGFEKPMIPPKVISNYFHLDTAEQQMDIIKKEIDLINRQKTKNNVICSQIQLNSNDSETSLYNELLIPTLNFSETIIPYI